ncbi:chromate transporter [Thermosporothrix hazakensis]|jgi:chromate transporter|uniref:Chromate transporter n=2 Tax=Thermosporothrix TaxID=768650 RepID=A0A326UAE8_THEHA|nr:chromate transporter [Thermosporothrix hazakensis]PZW24685.1 chromate transporter [Thermosporothrix hazakensis]BBH90333.1 hypothetical protein KTC_50840 [Thermosporothrix sp. COM3]GCE48369.1 hypothetical protein KTH_32380 [Thermosporothrix hazakensis]
MINPLLYFLIFLRASLFSSGGLANLPMLQQDLLGLKWAQHADFGRAIAISELSPGPSGLWVIALGYLTYGIPGAALAFIAIILPPLFVLVISAIYDRIERQRWVQGMMKGITLAIVGISLASGWNLIQQPGAGWREWAIALCVFALGLTQKFHVVILLALAGIAGFFLYH